MTYRTKRALGNLTLEHLKVILLHKIQTEERLQQIDDSLAQTSPQLIQEALQALESEGKIERKP